MAISVGIRGAGAAGLSLARALLHRIPSVEITVFDKRERLPHPKRTFCFFSDSRSSCDPPPSHLWKAVSFSGTDFCRTIDCSTTPYSLIEGDAFFSKLLVDLESQGVQFHWGCQQTEVRDHRILTNLAGHTFDFVIDAAFEPASRQATLWQSFAGIWVEAGHTVFNPDEAILMDLGESSYSSPISFIYLLPTSGTTALIEHTSFSRKPMSKEWHLAECRRWIASKGLSGISERNIENGAIPMGLIPEDGASKNLRVGSAGGAIRISTGFAFQAIQAQVDDIAMKIAGASDNKGSRQIQQPSVFPAWMRLCDSLFIQALSRAPENGGMIMGQLLRRAPARELIAFLSGNASFFQALQVMITVPKATMLRALCLG